jgi:hypothetical protein
MPILCEYGLPSAQYPATVAENERQSRLMYSGMAARFDEGSYFSGIRVDLIHHIAYVGVSSTKAAAINSLSGDWYVNGQTRVETVARKDCVHRSHTLQQTHGVNGISAVVDAYQK